MPRLGKRCYLAFDVGPIYDESGRVIAVVETLRDLTARKQLESELETLVGHDSLTSIANRRTFDQKLIDEWQRSRISGASLSLALADVDFFKQYNDSYGHQKGDECLRLVAKCLHNQALRPHDVAARVGGEEFALILPQTPLEGALVVAERLREAVEASVIPHEASQISPFVTISVGVTCSTEAVNVQTFFAQADSALYEAKRQGRNRVIPYGDTGITDRTI
jgi:diguanylate cyclase (GGDEF)-like protein